MHAIEMIHNKTFRNAFEMNNNEGGFVNGIARAIERINWQNGTSTEV